MNDDLARAPLAPSPPSPLLRWLGGGAVACVLIAGFAGLPAPAGLDPLARDTCIAVVPALEAEGRIEILSIDVPPEGAFRRRGDIRVGYRVVEGDDTRDAHLVCAFADPHGSGEPRILVALRDDDGVLPPGRFFALKRFWLTDRAALAEGLARISLGPSVRPSPVARGLAVAVAAAVGLGLAALVWALVRLRRARRAQPSRD